MNANAEEMDLRERLDLMQRMIAEGRRKQESWGWTFVLWGIAYYVAFFWAWLGNFPLAWPITMSAGALLTFIGFSRPADTAPRDHHRPRRRLHLDRSGRFHVHPL